MTTSSPTAADNEGVTTVRGAALLLGLPTLAAAIAAGAALAEPAAHAKPAAHANPAAHAKPSPRATPTRPAKPSLPAKPAAPVKPERPTIAGKWYFANGVLLFYRTGASKDTVTYTDRVILQRPSVFCPKVNDQDGQMVLHHKRGSRVYTGTWQWFYPSNCQLAGYGPVAITVWWDNDIAVFSSAPPPGMRGPTSNFQLARLK